MQEGVIVKSIHVLAVNNRRDLVYLEPDDTRMCIAVKSPENHPSYMTPDTDTVDWVYSKDRL